MKLRTTGRAPLGGQEMRASHGLRAAREDAGAPASPAPSARPTAPSPAAAGSPPAWMAVGLHGLARMSPEDRLIAVANIEALILAAYGDGPTPALRGPGAKERARDVLVRLGWAEPGIFLRAPAADVLARIRTEIAAAGLG